MGRRKKHKSRIWEKIDVKITGYISLGLLAVLVGVLIYLVVLATIAAGTLPIWAAYAGFGIIVCNVLSIQLAKWGQAQTGRHLKANRLAVRLHTGMIVVMALIYILGLIL